MPRKKASQFVEQAESRRRFAAAAAAAASAQQTTTQGNAQKQASSAATSTALTTTTSPARSPLPPNYTLSAPAAELLNGSCDLLAKIDKLPSSPVKLASSVVGLEKLNLMVMIQVLPSAAMARMLRKITLVQAIMELEDAPMDSLSPKLQALKLGFEQMPLDPTKPKGIERRFHEILRAAGEPPIKIIFSDWKLDRSTIPPKRIVKTDQERRESLEERDRQFLELKKRNRKVFAAVMPIFAEIIAFMPTNGPDPLPGGSEGWLFRMPDSVESFGYGCFENQD